MADTTNTNRNSIVCKNIGSSSSTIQSHHIVFKPILHELAHRGHHLTVLTPYPEDKPIPNITEILVHTTTEDDLSKYQFAFTVGM